MKKFEILTNRKLVRLLILSVCLFGFFQVSRASQPKILEVTDNFGRSFDTSGASDGWTNVNIEEELLITNNTRITLCVNKVSAENKDSLVYDFKTLSEGEGDTLSTTDNCNTWELTREDYTSLVGFRIRVGNKDGIEYSVANRDYVVDYYFRNVILEGEDKETTEIEYDIMKINRNEYRSLKEKVSTLENKNKKLKNTIDNKENKIEGLNDTLKSLGNRVDILLGKLEQKNETISQLESEADKWKVRAKNLNKTLKEERKPDNPISGFFAWVGSWT